MNTNRSDEVRNNEGTKANSQFDREPKRSGVWDWTSRIISIIAIVISLLSAYVTVIRRTDALSVYIPHGFPMVFIEDASERIGLINIDADWTLINSGTGAIAVVEEAVGVAETGSNCLTPQFISYETPPVVIKSGDITVQGHGKVRESDFWTPGKNDAGMAYELLREEGGKLDEGTEITVCIFFSVVTSANVTEKKWLPLYKTKLKKLSNVKLEDTSNDYTYNFDSDKTIPILYHFGTIFD
jgi:hypothetical protein